MPFAGKGHIDFTYGLDREIAHQVISKTKSTTMNLLDREIACKVGENLGPLGWCSIHCNDRQAARQYRPLLLHCDSLPIIADFHTRWPSWLAARFAWDAQQAKVQSHLPKPKP